MKLPSWAPFVMLGAAVLVVGLLIGDDDVAVGPQELAVTVLAPDGQVWATYLGQVDPPTPLQGLRLAAENGTIDGIETTTTSDGCDTYVVAVGGHRASGASGWFFEVKEGEGWTVPGVGAGCLSLTDGDQLRWRFGRDGL